MEISGFDKNDISKQSKEALKSEIWQEMRKAMKTEIRHFGEELLKDDPYGYPWEQVVDEYLKNGYKKKDAQYELTVLGLTYKVLKREEVTVFYDADGNTLFDVANERLEKEYTWIDDSENTNTEITKSEESDNGVAEEKGTGLEEEKTNTEAGEAQEKEQSEDAKEATQNNGTDNDVISPGEDILTSAEDIKAAKENNNSSVYIGVVGAVTKLQEELKKAKDKTFANPVIEHLIARCKESESLAADICQDHKTWEKCYKHIYEQARKQAKGNSCVVRDDVVFEWAEDYFRKDDKAEEEKKAKEAAERKKKQDKKSKTDDKKKEASKPAIEQEKKPEAPKPQSKPKKNNKDIDGQLDIFSMMGI